ncbi:MAG: hypothetical protein HY343_05045 [Lentisphaerae bacterium]|nr:hypothetical protein [Lentisphaerota bacterium]
MNQDRKQKRSAAKYLIRFLAGVSIFVLVFTGIPVYRDWFFLCENTGAKMGYRQWFFGLRTKHWHQESALEAFMTKEYPSELTNRWTSYSGTGINLFGEAVLFGHGSPGPISRVCGKPLETFLNALSPEAKLDLYRLFASTNHAKISSQATQILERAFLQ